MCIDGCQVKLEPQLHECYYICTVSRQNLSSGFSTMSVTDYTVQPQKAAILLKFCKEEVQGLYFLCSKNKSADQLPGYRAADLQKAGFLMTGLILSLEGLGLS